MPADLATLSQQFADLIAAAAPRLVAVRGAEGGQVSGLIWRTGLVVAAHEALSGEDDFDVFLADGSQVRAELAGRDPTTDVALLRLTTPDFDDWTHAPTPAVGSLAIVAGRGAYSPLASFGLVSEIGPAWRSMRGGDIDARITLGLRLSSRAEGGAVLAPDGGLIGLAVTGPRRRALAIPASTVERAVRTLSEKGYVPRGYLGVSLHTVGRGEGAIAVGIEPEGPAAHAGFVVGDLVTTWNGETIRSVGDVANRLGTGTVGETAKLGVLRGGVASEIDVTIGERPRG
ncbi:S1C family serine protease [Devosia nitrariae]|uniref:Serine protease n=1 Tax=Devosia nitrariae TaxID=2071872 RepID=A0ABQ5W210_9HYPH|nr:S1C family serine protease [Devosia nitrariae]GLQ53901.1 serine protease [Devosia nitrariae]